MSPLKILTTRTLLKTKPQQRLFLNPCQFHVESTTNLYSFLGEELKSSVKEKHDFHKGILQTDATKWRIHLPQAKLYHQFSHHFVPKSVSTYPNLYELRYQVIIDKARSRGLVSISSNCLQVRHKSKKKQSDTTETDSESDEDDALDEDDFQAPPKFKVIKIHPPSTRVDAIISTALDVARNRVQETFFDSGLLLNGEKLFKKATKMDEGDYVDVIMDKVEDQLKVKRVKILKIYPQKTKNDKSVVKVRVWKSPFLLDSSKRS